MSGLRVRAGAALAILCLAAGPAPAQILNVTDFDSLGRFPVTPGVYLINTTGDPTLETPDGTVYPGVVYEGIAIFTFDAITLGDGMTIRASGDRPVALLSYTDVIIRDTGGINVSGQSGAIVSGGSGGPGGGSGGNGGAPGKGLPGNGPGGGGPGSLGGSGGGFGGRGGGANGGARYGNLVSPLEGGSGGGGGHANSQPPSRGGGGGGGGGTIEIGALGDILVGGSSILAMGGSGGGPVRNASGGGGGSGGGILLHGDTVILESPLRAQGGNGSTSAGGGGGGRVVILTGQGGFWDDGSIDVSGGSGPGGDGEPGRVTILEEVLPEYSRVPLAGLGCLAVLDLVRRRRKRSAAPAPADPAAS